MQPLYTACIAPLNWVDMGDDGTPYIVKMVDGERQWVTLGEEDTEQCLSTNVVDLVKKSKSGPTKPATHFTEGDVVTGVDGNSYNVCVQNGKKVYELFQLRYSWCNTGITYVSVKKIDLECESRTKISKGSKGSKGKSNKHHLQ